LISLTLRVLLIAGSLLTLIFMLNRIRISKIQIKDSIFWIFFSLLLLLISIFPGIALWASRLLGVLSPINFVLLFIIFLLVIQLFIACMRISLLDDKLRKIAQRVAIENKNKAALGGEPEGEDKTSRE